MPALLGTEFHRTAWRDAAGLATAPAVETRVDSIHNVQTFQHGIGRGAFAAAVAAAARAPGGINAQTWRFIVVRDSPCELPKAPRARGHAARPGG